MLNKILILIILLSFQTLFALDIYALIDSNCATHLGVIINVDEVNVTFINMNGETDVIPKNTLHSIMIFNTLENPIKEIKVEKGINFLKEIKIKDNDEVFARAWAVNFIEDLVMFYDTQGKTIVINLYDITKIKPAKSDPNQKTFTQTKFEKTNFIVSDILSKCQQIKAIEGEGVRPTHILTDKIAISEFLNKLENGFKRLASFEERTNYYAKPMLFEERARLGIIILKNYRENANFPLPIYYQWSNGRPYRFQSLTVLGNSTVEWLPDIEPVFNIRSDLKSHLFNASFVGNVYSLSAGNKYYNAEFSGKPDLPSCFAQSFNYMAIMGADYGPYSVSFGPFFETFYIKVLSDDRELLATSFSPALRFMYTLNKFRVRAVYSWTRREMDENNKSKQLVSYRDWMEQNDSITNFTFSNDFVRFGVDYNILKSKEKDLIFTADELFSFGKYSETYNLSENFFKYKHSFSSFSLTQRFGHYISIKGILNYYLRMYDYNFPQEAKKYTKGSYTYGGAFELLF